MLVVVEDNNAAEYRHLLDEMFRLRARVFRDRLKWDVVVTDGFTGNILLKSSEAVAKLLIDSLKKELTSNFIYKLGAALAKPAFGNLKKMMEPEEVGAAPLLGIDGLVFVGHGRSNARAIYSALGFAQQCANLNLLETMRGTVQAALSEV